MAANRSYLPDAYAYYPVSDNPTPSTSPFFTLCLEHKWDPYWIAKEIGLALDFGQPEITYNEDTEPTCTKLWTWQRFGQTRTVLPDDRVIYIGGEHEDWYDPMFVIFNDVVVYDPETGLYDLYRYPRSVFPPTDNHTATYIESDNSIWIIGNVGYSHLRGTQTPVYRLDVSTLSIHKVELEGPSPGWVSHHAVNVVTREGKTSEGLKPSTETIIEVAVNGQNWELSVKEKTWKLVGNRAGSLPVRPVGAIST